MIKKINRIINFIIESIFDKTQQTRRKYGKYFIKNKNLCIISNNCCGADIYHNYGLKFNSPTVNLQILPCDFPEFCENLDYYLNKCSLFEIKYDKSLLTDEQYYCLKKIYGETVSFPIAKCGDIVIAFQHFKTFKEAEEKWNIRKNRIIKSNLCYLFVVSKEYSKYAESFCNICLPDFRKALLTVNWDCDAGKKHRDMTIKRIIQKPNGHFMDRYNLFIKCYEKTFNSVRWLNYVDSNITCQND